MPATPEQLRARWETEDGKRRLDDVVEAAKKGEPWARILEGFAHVDEVRNGRDLRFAPLGHRELNGADLSDAHLTCACLLRSLLGGADLRGTTLIKAGIVETQLPWADLRGASLDQAKLFDSRLHGAKIQGASFECVQLWDTEVGAHFGYVDFSDAEHDRRTSFLGTDISRNNWSGNPLLKRHIEDQQWLDCWQNRSWVNRYLLYPLWAISCDCGRSWLRWGLWSMVLAITFAFIFCFGLGQGSFETKHLEWSLHTTIYYSVVTFTTLGFGDVVPKTTAAAYWVMAEVILGYIMLGGLISIFATKLARRS